ncbi:hypothetical protein BDW02DRAFT_564621 [Decorospora gaudefroyi]|uniref:Coenzyme Q-binding protein COQ10 START domain-containing protein n=1 Tax=Decorospora gaudefroyi TaxID=184978 RepID=A0A6A5KUX7_9PLEO|nr:hypothetical protein BDW02DRAFT_564621 [Decorospora gaudefroyi]
MFKPNFLSLLCLSLSTPLIASEYTNLPNVPPGVFEVSTRTEISTTLSAAWHTLIDFPNYAAWNPFVRTSIVTSANNITLPDQRPAEGKYLFMRVQIPPLPLPVNEKTLDNPAHTQFAYERIAHVQPELGRLAWVYLPEDALTAQRWQAVSDIGNGTVLYEAREVFSGPLAALLQAAMEKGLQESFDGQGEGLKLWLEGGAK